MFHICCYRYKCIYTHTLLYFASKLFFLFNVLITFLFSEFTNKLRKPHKTPLDTSFQVIAFFPT